MKKNRLLVMTFLITLGIFSASFLVVHGLAVLKTGGAARVLVSALPAAADPQVPPKQPSKPTALPMPVPASLLQTQGAATAKGTIENLSVFGKSVDISLTPILVTAEGKLLLPLRKLGEAMGYTVRWDNGTKSAILEKNAESIVLRPGSAEYTWGASARTLSSKPEVKDNRLYVPADFITANPAYVLRHTADSVAVDAAASAARQVLTGEIVEIISYSNGLGLKVKNKEAALVQLYVTDDTKITDYSTGEILSRSALQNGTKAIFSYTELPENEKSAYNMLSGIEIVQLPPASGPEGGAQ